MKIINYLTNIMIGLICKHLANFVCFPTVLLRKKSDEKSGLPEKEMKKKSKVQDEIWCL